MSVKSELLKHRYKMDDRIIQFKMYLSAAGEYFNIEDLDKKDGVTFGFNEVNVVRGGQQQYRYEYDRSIRNSMYKVRKSIINDHPLEGSYYSNRLVICNDYGLGFVLHVPAEKIDNDRDIYFWIEQARVLLVSAFLNDVDCSTSRRMDFGYNNRDYVEEMTSQLHEIANQLDYVLYDAPCIDLNNSDVWNERIAGTIEPKFIKHYTTEITTKK